MDGALRQSTLSHSFISNKKLTRSRQNIPKRENSMKELFNYEKEGNQIL